MTDVIRTTSLSRRFGRLTAVDGLDLAVSAGSVYALVGPNGAGKTTTLRMLLNIVEPSAGHAEVLGVDSRRLRPAELARIGYVSENQRLPDWMTVAYLTDHLKPFYPSWDDARVRDLLSRLRVPTSQRLKDLSRGMRMKAALAVALAFSPEVLILDEPFSGLDALVRDDVIQELVASASDTTILISSHDLADLETFATHVGYLDQGRLWCSETLGSLTGRFRELEVTSDRRAPLPTPWPPHWLEPEHAGSILRFVDTRFAGDRSIAQVRDQFGETAIVTAHPMSLRQIFVSLARRSPPPEAL